MKKIMKKKTMIPFFVFVIGIIVVSLLTVKNKKIQIAQNQEKATLNAMTYSQRLQSDIESGADVTKTLEQMIISENGKVVNFQKIAKNMMNDSIQSIQIAPNGVVSDIYPEKGNEAGKIDLIHDKSRGEICRYGRDHHQLTIQGPFQLKQGGQGLAMRNPVYLTDSQEKSEFWGFTIVIIRVPDVFSDTVNALGNFGYSFKLYKTVVPWEETYSEVYNNINQLDNPISYSFEVGSQKWKLDIAPQEGWYNEIHLYEIGIIGLLIVLLITGLTTALLILDENRKKFKDLAIKDSLTGVYNRRKFEKEVRDYLIMNPHSSCVVALFDIDDFKLINDLYGHATGDQVLIHLTNYMKQTLKGTSIYARTGGDEFCVFFPFSSYEDVETRIEEFVKSEKYFEYEGKKHLYTISLGYASYPLYANNYLQLANCADSALYEVKLKGKNGYQAYLSGLQLNERKQLGISYKDISTYLPISFVVYDENQILFVSDELIRLAGCQNMNELISYTGNKVDCFLDFKEGRAYLKRKDETYIEILTREKIRKGPLNQKVHYTLIKIRDE